MDKAAGWRVVDEQRAVLADLLADLTPAEWDTPSLCAGWTVRHVAAHLSIAALTPTSQVLLAALRAGGSFDRMIHRTAVQRAADRSTAEIVADLRSIVGSRHLAPSTFWRDPLTDILVHTQDIARPLGRPLPVPTEAAREAAEWSWRRRFPFFPGRRFPGIEMVADDVDWRRGAGEELHGPVASLLLLSTGRRAALADLRGPGLDRLDRLDAVDRAVVDDSTPVRAAGRRAS
jgi:uncharacterized protein (TIGR03083 family)